MSWLVLLGGWTLAGAWSAQVGLPSRERNLVWTLAGSVFGPLWWLVRVDRPSMAPGTNRATEVATERVVDDLDRARGMGVRRDVVVSACRRTRNI